MAVKDFGCTGFQHFGKGLLVVFRGKQHDGGMLVTGDFTQLLNEMGGLHIIRKQGYADKIEQQLARSIQPFPTIGEAVTMQTFHDQLLFQDRSKGFVSFHTEDTHPIPRIDRAGEILPP